MAVSFEQFANELKAFRDSKAILNALKRDLRKPLPALRKEVRASATETLPGGAGGGGSRGGSLASWVAKARVTAKVKDRGRAAGIRVKVSRASQDGDRADLKALDDSGRVRHPLRGNRGHWYSQSVPPGFFTKAWERTGPKFIQAAEEAMDKALDVIRRG